MLLVVQAAYSDYYQFTARRGYQVSYHLSEPLVFHEPHYARLVNIDGIGRPCIILADFVKSQQVNGIPTPLLCVWSATQISTWVPIAQNYLSTTGLVEIYRSDGNPMTKNDQRKTSIVLAIEIASESWIHGTKRAN